MNKTDVRQLVLDVSYLKSALSSADDSHLDAEELHLDSLTLVWLMMTIERRIGRRVSVTQPVTVDSLHLSIVGENSAADSPASSGVEVLDRLVEVENLNDPSAYYEHLRTTSPIALYPARHLDTLFGAEYYCFVSRYAEARYIMTSPLFRVPDLGPLFPQGDDPRVNRMHQLFANNVLALNPPLQTERRRLLTSLLSAGAAEQLREITERLCEEAVASVVGRLQAGDEVDVHAALSEKVALETIATFLGVSPEDAVRLKPFASDLIDASHPVRDKRTMATAVEAVDALQQHFSGLLAERVRSPRDDLASRLGAAVVGDQVDERDVVDVLMGLWITGFLSTAAGIDTAVVNWARDRALFAAANESPAGLRGYVNESLRLDPPLPTSGAIREATTDIELGGVTLPRGTQVIILFGAVNRDPEVFEHPEKFLPLRNNSQAMSFGVGAHYCVGAQLARMEMSAVMTQLDRRLQAQVEVTEAVRRKCLLPRMYDTLKIRISGTARQT
ncbi:cytochrome P450 [Lentzea sp. NPDC004782]|uniref:cytochrome P450 n=1 Tax=Lentzea sp. NPDC004782 TaxID=3154458 RepID=UPI0033A5475E